MDTIQENIIKIKEIALEYAKQKGYNHIIFKLNQRESFGDIEYEGQVYILKNNKKQDDSPQYSLNDYFEKLFPSLGDLLVEVKDEKVTIYSEKKSSDATTIAEEELLECWRQTVIPHISDDHIYSYNLNIGDSRGMIGRSHWFDSITNPEYQMDYKEKSFFDADFIISDLYIQLLAITFPLDNKVSLIFSRNQKIEVKVASLHDLIEDIKSTYQLVLKNENAECLISELDFTKYHEKKTWFNIKNEEYTKKIGKLESGGYTPASELARIHNKINKPINKMKIVATQEELIITADIEVPELNIGLLQAEAMENTDINTLFTYLESGNESKIKQALEFVNQDENIKAIAQRRYFPFLKAQLNKVDVVLEDLVKIASVFNEKVLGSCFTSRYANIQKDLISFAMMKDETCEAFVNFIGSTVDDCLSVDEFIKIVNLDYKLEKETDLTPKLRKLESDYKDYLKNIIKEGPDTWFTKCFEVLSMFKLSKLMYDHSDFWKIQKSPVYREFMFFCQICAYDSVYYDVFQSSGVDMTDIIWLYKDVPSINIVESDCSIPDNPLDFELTLSTKDSDEANWKIKKN
ncbi:MAG: hypothetical protein N4A49_02020 [Marinifilaceae bacterium]|jgi:hypothetical protein|nr:hypothetical protein [Marinifilaceae bacterium]